MRSISLVTMVFLPGTFFAVRLSKHPFSDLSLTNFSSDAVLHDLFQLISLRQRRNRRIRIRVDILRIDRCFHNLYSGHVVVLSCLPAGESSVFHSKAISWMALDGMAGLIATMVLCRWRVRRLTLFHLSRTVSWSNFLPAGHHPMVILEGSKLSRWQSSIRPYLN